MKYKKGDLVKVIEVDVIDVKSYGIKEGETYEVIGIDEDGFILINAGKDDRFMYNFQLKKVKKKSKKDLSYWKTTAKKIIFRHL